MRLTDIAASTAIGALRPSSNGSGSSGGIISQQGVRGMTRAARANTSAVPRLTRVEPAPLSHSGSNGRETIDESTPLRPKPLFSFGVIADVQYADQDDGWNYAKTYRRYYRGALRKLRNAIDVWVRDETHSFVLQLGDVIDGFNKRNGKSEAALTSVKKEIDRLADSLPLGVLNSLGNHELYNFPKQRWARELDCSNFSKAVILRPSGGGHQIRAAGDSPTPSSSGDCPRSDHIAHVACDPPPVPVSGFVSSTADGVDSSETAQGEECFYYSFCPDDSHRFIALDCYDVHAIREELGPGEQEDDVKNEDGDEDNVDGKARKLGMEMLLKHNPNENKNDNSGMDGLAQRFVQYNGGLSEEQLLWLENELVEASRAGQRVVCFGHVPIHPVEPSSLTLVWNYEDVLRVLHKFDCVAMFLSGHKHRETYVRDDHGIHHVSLAAALEAPADEEAFASIDVYPNCLELRGYGVVESRTLALGALAEFS